MVIKKNKVMKISIFVLMLLLLFSFLKYYKVSNDYHKYAENSELEIKLLESQLDEILYKYDSLSLISNQYEKSESVVFNSKEQVLDKNFVKQEARSLEEFEKRDISNSESVRTKFKKSSLSGLIASNVDAKGVKIYSDVYSKSNAKIQQLRVCYTLMSNQLVSTGSKKIYIQVVNPENQIISKGDLSLSSLDGSLFKYSAFSEVDYNNQDLDVCAYVDLEDFKTIKGLYKINIYNDFLKIGTTTFEYR